MAVRNDPKGRSDPNTKQIFPRKKKVEIFFSGNAYFFIPRCLSPPQKKKLGHMKYRFRSEQKQVFREKKIQIIALYNQDYNENKYCLDDN
jgi:hypothetical protein